MAEKVLITGVTGFVGSHMADWLMANHPEIELHATKRYHLSRMDNVRHIEEQLNWHDCNLTDPISTVKLVQELRPDKILHFAAESFVSPSWDHPHHYMTVNYNATLNLLEGIRLSGADTKILIPGSGEEYGEIHEDEIPITPESPIRPVNPYAVSKVAQDLIGFVYFKSYGTKVIRTRAFNHEGPRRDKVFGIPWYAYQVARIEAGKQSPHMEVGYLEDLRNFTHVQDIVEAYWLATDRCEPGELYLVGSEAEAKVYTFRQALEMLISMSTTEGISYEVVAKYVRPTNVPRLIADTQKFRDITGWKPTVGFEQILSETLDYWRAQVAAGR
jgi:GDP-4-dehydro-6-deoxy-D-mannose reductase